MIETITLRNYKGHAETTVPCERLTVLVGENASGKTSVLEAVRWVSEGLSDVLPPRLLRRGAQELGVTLSGNRDGAGWQIDAEYKLRLQEHQPDELRAQRLEVVNLPDRSLGRRPLAVSLALRADTLASPSTARSVRPEITTTGSGLASVLAHLKLSETERFDRIVQRLREVVPIVRGIRFEKVQEVEEVPRVVRVEEQQIHLTEKQTVIRDALLFDFADAERVPAALVSEGTLLTLGMLTALETVERRTYLDHERAQMVSPVEVVLIDDIDRALHPRAQRALVATLRVALAAEPHLQVIATSHSPYLVDALKPEEVVVLGRDVDDKIVAKRLDSFPDERLKAMLSTGELWMSEGEHWVRR